jgi:hypothetical protein
MENNNQTPTQPNPTPNPSQPARVGERVIQPITPGLTMPTANSDAPQVAAQPNPAVAPSTISPASPTSPVAPTIVPPTSQPAAPADNSTPLFTTPQPTATVQQSPDGYVGGFLTGSAIANEPTRLPVGVYIIVGLMFLNAISSLFNVVQSNGFYTVAMLFSLLIAVGMLAKLDVARKALLWLMGIVLIVTVLSFFLLAATINRINQKLDAADAQIAQADKSNWTAKQKHDVQVFVDSAHKGRDDLDRKIRITYFIYGLTLIEPIVILIYLTRPKVKSAFRVLEA